MWQHSTLPRWQYSTQAVCGNTVHHNAGNQTQAACGNQLRLRSAMTLSIMKENRWTSPGATHNPLREAAAITGDSSTGRVWQRSTPPCWQSDTSRVWQYSTPPRWQSVPRVAGSTQGSPGPVLRRMRCGLRRNCVALTHANYSQRCVWQSTLAISAACGSPRWQTNTGRVWQPTLAISAACGKHAGNSAACGNRYPPLTLAEGADARQEIPGG